MKNNHRTGKAKSARRQYDVPSPAVLPGIPVISRVVLLLGICVCILLLCGPVSDARAQEKKPEAKTAEGKEGSGLADQAYSFDGGLSWTEKPYLNVKENGTYHVLVRDKLGNTTEGSFEVKNIDREAPSAKLSVEPEGFVREKAAIKVEASDAGSGLADQAYSFDGGVTWSRQPLKEIDENGVYTVKIRDKAGNVRQESITAGNIDREPPVVDWSLEPQKWYEGKAQIVVRARDEGCGLDAKAFSWDAGQTYQVSGRKEIETPGRYRVLVRDALGNCIYTDIDAVRSTKEDGGGNGGQGGEHGGGTDGSDGGGSQEETPDIPGGAESIGKGEFPWQNAGERRDKEPEPAQRNGRQPGGKRTGNSGEEALAENSGESTEQYVEEPETVLESKSLEEPLRMAKPDTREIRSLSRWKSFMSSPAGWAAVTVTAAALLTLAAAGLYLLFMGIGIYNFDGEEAYRYRGMAAARRREDYFWMRVPDRILDKGITDEYRLKPGFLFVRLHQGEEILVRTDATENSAQERTAEICLMVEKEMDCIL